MEYSIDVCNEKEHGSKVRCLEKVYMTCLQQLAIKRSIITAEHQTIEKCNYIIDIFHEQTCPKQL